MNVIIARSCSLKIGVIGCDVTQSGIIGCDAMQSFRMYDTLYILIYIACNPA